MSTIPLRPAPGLPPATRPWHWNALLLAPHRLGFFLAMLVLAASGLWWAAVQLDRLGLGLHLRYAVSPTLVHGAVMTLGFFPLFFCGFLFTAGPRWLGVAPPTARDVLRPMVLLAGGWLAWLVAAHVHAASAVAALLVALAGLAGVTLRSWRLVRASPVADKVHAQAIGVALLFGCAALAGIAVALWLDAVTAALAIVRSALWGFIVAIFASVAHRMIPFFTSSALPGIGAWRPGWVLAALLGIAAFEAAAVWVDLLTGSIGWQALRAALELAAGALLVWLAVAWGLVQSLRVRLLGMLHLGFLWLGLGLVLSALSLLIGLSEGVPALPLAGQHAVTMGGLGSLMIAMVTRVSCGHSGRALVADNLVWLLFWLLQAAVVLRIAAAVPGWPASALLAGAAVLWAIVMLAWGIRYGSWYGRARADGMPG